MLNKTILTFFACTLAFSLSAEQQETTLDESVLLTCGCKHSDDEIIQALTCGACGHEDLEELLPFFSCRDC